MKRYWAITEVERQSRREMNFVHIPTKDRKRLNDKLDPRIREYPGMAERRLGAILRKRTRTPNLIFIFSVVFNIPEEFKRASRMISGQTRGDR